MHTVVSYLEARGISPSILVERLYTEAAIETCFIGTAVLSHWLLTGALSTNVQAPLGGRGHKHADLAVPLLFSRRLSRGRVNDKVSF